MPLTNTCRYVFKFFSVKTLKKYAKNLENCKICFIFAVSKLKQKGVSPDTKK